VLQSVGFSLDYLCSLDDENIDHALSEFSRKMRSELFMLRENARTSDSVLESTSNLYESDPTLMSDDQARPLSLTESGKFKAESSQENLDALLVQLCKMDPICLSDDPAIPSSHTESVQVKAESSQENLESILASIEEAML
jgi:hypothetical protein